MEVVQAVFSVTKHSFVPVISVLVCYKITVIYWHSRSIKTKINADKVEHQGQGVIRAALEVKLRAFDPEAGTLLLSKSLHVNNGAYI